ncbi:MAG: NADH-quinone oxidoreductase subunit M [Methylococcaceae bacterium]|nr:NADH-quinone oxidoreductase subunit M [Methylococcaceae bacterium]
MNEIGVPLLSSLIALPLLTALLLGYLPSRQLAKQLALSVAVIELLLSLVVVKGFNAESDALQLVEQYTWIELLNIHFEVGIDGISVLFLPSTALLTLMTMISAWNSVQYYRRLHFALLLILEGIIMGVFCATDMILFFLFWELTLPVIFFLIGLWGIGPQRRGAALKYSLFMLFGSVPLLFAIIMLAINHATQVGGMIPQDLTFSFPVLLATPVADDLQPIIFLLLLLSFAVKTPLVPFHTWLPTVSMEAPTQMTALLVGLKLGLYGILRYAMTLTPSAAVQYSWVLGILGAVTLIYGAFIALQQSNLRRILAYTSISQSGLVVIGITSLNMQGIQGALLQLLSFTLVASSLMLLAGFIQNRLGSTDIIHLGGVAKVMPKLTVFFFLFAFASIGTPGSSSFPAEFLLMVSALSAHLSLGVTALAAAVMSAACFLSFSRRAFLGAIVQVGVEKLQDLRPREFVLLIIPAVLMVGFGFFPEVILESHRVTAEAWLTRLINQPIFNMVE